VKVESVAVMPETDALHRILEDGIRAPSADNVHHLRFVPSAHGVQLLSTDLPTWNAQPHRKALAMVSYGAVVENMALSSASLGLSMDVQWMPDPRRPDVMAVCRWSFAHGEPEPYAAVMAERHTNRRFYRREPVPADVRRRIADAGAVPGAGVSWLDAPVQRRRALQAIRMAEAERFRRSGLHHEIYSAVRFDVGWRRTADEGLPPGALEIEPPMRAAFHALSRWPLMRVMTMAGLHHALGLRAAWLPCRYAPLLGMVWCDAVGEPWPAFALGRSLQRAWLACTSEGLAFQPLAATLALSHQHPGGPWVSARVQQLIRDRVAELGASAGACLFFRAGWAEPPSVVTARPPIDRYLAQS
jgi:hypothetical protein